MKTLVRHSMITKWMTGSILAASSIFAPLTIRAQSSGPQVEICNVATVDGANDVEEMVCLIGDQSQLYADVDVDDFVGGDSQNFPSGNPYVSGVGAEAQLFGSNNNLTWDSGLQDAQILPWDGLPEDPPEAGVYTSLVPQLNVTYSLDGLYSECYDPTGSGQNCSWTSAMDGGVWAQVTVTGGASAPTLSLSSSSASSLPGQPVTFAATISSGPTGSLTFYDGTTALGTAGISGNSASFTTATLGSGSHSITALWAGNSSYGAATSNALSQTVSATVYSYCIPGPSNPNCTSTSSGYAPNGNIVNYIDSVNGAWSLGYDALNRLASAQVSPAVAGTGASNLCWAYDSFGNRTSQILSNQGISVSGGYCVPQSPSSAVWSGKSTAYSAANQIDHDQDAGSGASLGAPVQYDPSGAGNVIADGLNGASPHSYLYDGEGRVCAVYIPAAGSLPAQMIQYLYDANGTRIGKGTIQHWSCNTDTNIFAPTNEYVIDQQGNQVTELDGSGNWKHTNAYAGGQLIATLDAAGGGTLTSPAVHYQLTDWLGTRRVQVSSAGIREETCQSLPYGDLLNCVQANVPTADDATEHHFTGKERDAESGLDYFGARYYASSMGRFMSPDWSDEEDPIPYADTENPQTLNLYGYVTNNPMRTYDPTGHDGNPVLDILDDIETATMTDVDAGIAYLAPAATAVEEGLAPYLGGSITIGVTVLANPVSAGIPNEQVRTSPYILVQPPAPQAGRRKNRESDSKPKVHRRKRNKGPGQDKHQAPRPGRTNTKDRQNPNWVDWRDHTKLKPPKQPRKKTPKDDDK